MGILDFIKNLNDAAKESIKKRGEVAYDRGYDDGCNARCRSYGSTDNYAGLYYSGYNNGYYETYKKKYALTCRKCGGDAFPVRETTRHYNCKCGNKFTGSNHPFKN